MTPFFDPSGIAANERPAILRRRAEAHRLVFPAEHRHGRRRPGPARRPGGDAR